MLELHELSFGYPGASTPVLDRVSLEVPGGCAVGLQAPSGSGKTTLLRIAASLLAPDRGDVAIAGDVVSGFRYAVPVSIRRKVGMIFQSPRTSSNPRLSLRHIIAEPLSFRDGLRRPRPVVYAGKVAELADLVQLTDDLLDRFPHQVSDGQLQRACLARALALDPQVLLCDEPTAMLDAPTTAVIMRVVGDRVRQGSAALVASHNQPLLDATCAVTYRLAALSTPPDRAAVR